MIINFEIFVHCSKYFSKYEIPCLQLLLCIDHTTVENLGQQNAFLSSLNTVEPGSMYCFVPVFSHDRKDNFQATKIVAKNPIDQINQMVTNPQPFRLTVKPLPKDHSIKPLKPSYVKLKKFCPSCHQMIDFDFCESCFNSSTDQTNLTPIPKRFKCSNDWCPFQTESEGELKQHLLIDHPVVFDARKKRRFDEFDETMRKYYGRLSKNCVSKVWATSKPLNLFKKRKLNPKCEPDVLDCIKEVIDIEQFFISDSDSES